MCEAYEEARQAAEEAKAWCWSISGRIQLLDYHLYRALVLAACHRDAPPEQQREDLEELRGHHQQLAEWAAHCPETFRAPERMVAAELARLLGHADTAPSLYEEALQAAHAQGHVHNAAVASELAAGYWKERRLPALALFYARHAREAYAQWGAVGKVRHLDMHWPQLASPVGGEDASSSGGYDTDASHLDVLSVVKAQQAISREINLGRLVATLLRVALENAGAQRGALLLPQGEALQVEALVDSAQGEVEAAPSEAAARELPWTLLSYVRRAGEHVLIDDAAEPHAFASDPFFARRPARSVLCLPLRRQEAFYGLLYLENALTPRAFPPGRLALLQHLASQAVISMENARLYGELQQAGTALRRANEELELRVEERTRELKQAQANLVDTARRVGMAEVASNVLHDVGNTLTSLMVDTQLLQQQVRESRVERAAQVFTVLEEHRHHLDAFTTQDERGRQLFVYLRSLAARLAQEQQSLKEGLEAMARNVERVRAIVQLQQDYPKATLLEEECALAEVLEEALRLQAGALQRAGVQVTTELAALPRVRVDRHRLLQILVNLLSKVRQAAEASPEPRTLGLHLTGDTQWARIQVRERLFRQGFTTRPEGHGIGLHSSALAVRRWAGSSPRRATGRGSRDGGFESFSRRVRVVKQEASAGRSASSRCSVLWPNRLESLEAL
jgi:GAF domain-containing protein